MATIALRMFMLSICLVSNVNATIYTLDKLLEVAFKNSKQLQKVELELRKAESQVQEVLGHGMPQISASLNLNHTNTSIDLDEERLQNTLNGLLDGLKDADEAGLIISKSAEFSGEMMKTPENNLALSLDVKQVIFAQGKVRLGLKVAKAHQRTLLCKYNFEKMKLKSEIMISYYSASLAQKNVNISSEAVSLAEQTHRLAVITHLVGRASELDTLSSLLNLEKAKIELQKAESSKRISYETIKMQSGITDASFEFSVEGEFQESQFSLSIDEVLHLVRNQNPNLEQLKGAGEIQKYLVYLARTDFYPKVYAGASISGMSMFDGAEDIANPTLSNNRTIYAGLSWDIFTGLSRVQKLRQAEADRSMSKLNELQIIEALELQARNVYETVIQSRNNFMSNESLIRLAEKRYLIAKKAYEVGSNTILDLQNAEFELNSAKISLNVAQFSYQSAIISLRLLMSDI